MKLIKLPAAVFVFALTVAGVCTLPFANWASAIDEKTQKDVAQEIEQMEAKLAAVNRGGDAADRDQMYSDDLIDIAASGWIYTKKQTAELGPNLGKVPGVNKVIKTSQIGRKVVVFNKDAVEIVWENETYFEVPDPQQVAIEAGTLTEDPAALAKAAPKGSRIGPGEASSPNPYRVRSTRLWLRIDGQWKIASSTATRIGERVIPGRF